jgi:hypothetical protein
MGTNFEMLVDVDVTAEHAEALCHAVLNRFRELRLITGKANDECVLGGQGYPPGSAVANLYKREEREYPFWEAATCGVEPEVGRGFNAWALGPVFKGFFCPSCGAQVEPLGGEMGNSVGKVIREWLDASGPALVACPKCRRKHRISQWHCKPPLGFGNLSFRFWNWPPLNSPAWGIDIAGVVRDISGHTIIRTYGHI